MIALSQNAFSKLEREEKLEVTIKDYSKKMILLKQSFENHLYIPVYDYENYSCNVVRVTKFEVVGSKETVVNEQVFTMKVELELVKKLVHFGKALTAYAYLSDD